MLRMQSRSGISLERYVAQSHPRRRSRDRTGAVGKLVSIMRLHRARLRIIRLRARQCLRLRVSARSGGRRQPRSRPSKKLSCRMELPSPENQDWLRVRSRQTTVTSTFSVFDAELKYKTLTLAKFSLRHRLRAIITYLRKALAAHAGVGSYF
jgi:hypothetical protein